MGNYRLLGQMLVNNGKITQSQLETALKQRSRSRRRIGGILVSLGFVNDHDIAKCLAAQYDLQIVDPTDIKPEPRALRLIGSSIALSRRVLPMRYTDDYIECAAADPLDFPTTDLIASLVGRRVMLHIAPMSSLVAAIRRAYGIKEHLSGRDWESPKRRRRVKPQSDRRELLKCLQSLDANCAMESSVI